MLIKIEFVIYVVLSNPDPYHMKDCLKYMYIQMQKKGRKATSYDFINKKLTLFILLGKG